jgi:hypothetical protein
MRAPWILAWVLIHATTCDAGTVSAFSFAISLADRVAGKTNSAATFTFTPPSNIRSNDDIVIQYPTNFFSNGVTPVALLSGGKTCSPTVTGATNNQVACLNVNAQITANTVVVLTLTGMAMGPVTAGDSIAESSIYDVSDQSQTYKSIRRIWGHQT